MRRTGFILIELGVVLAIAGILLGFALFKFGDGRKKLQEQQLEWAARRFIMEVRRLQQDNMYAPVDKQRYIIVNKGNGFYTIGLGATAKQYNLDEEGCGDIYFDTNARILFSQTGAVNDAAYIKLKHRENSQLVINLSLQPVTGRLEVVP